jgi:hypothetical protein
VQAHREEIGFSSGFVFRYHTPSHFELSAAAAATTRTSSFAPINRDSFSTWQLIVQTSRLRTVEPARHSESL